MGYEESCRRVADLCQDVGIAEANRMIDDDPFAGCVYSPDEIAEFNSPCRGCDGTKECTGCELNLSCDDV